MTTPTLTRSPQYVRATLCAAAAAAVLLGGGSTYALWSDEGDVDLDDTPQITAGEWVWDVDASDIEWWDTSDGLDGTEWQSGVVAPDWEPAGDPTWANEWRSDWEPDPGGYPIDITAFHIVPGDRVTGRFTIDADIAELVGQNLRATVTNAIFQDGTATADLPLVVDDVATAGNVVTIRVSYPADPADYDDEAGQTSSVSLGTYTVTLTQVRP
ncbi:hypothetical protein [Xylanimonas ulmi]|uniref:Alternate signal-mediated exported protein n=1 Tax=Xylanimonas ulmi TaxID=228973 RepID=A0A4V2EY75_9MICO|nr:hypothetical protein [Xylanibacterium ulmi]RZS62010.1 alternate signal-mediated exported protein [Xylanibacterium ulmi]